MVSSVHSLFAFLIVLPLCYATTLTINATIYDHSPLRNPDFENTIATDKGIALDVLGPDRKPIYAHGSASTKTVHNSTTFNTWFRDTPGVNLPIFYPITLTKGSNNIYTFSDTTFFPIDGKGFGNEQRNHNYHFCMEFHSTFTYQGKEVFQFTGDDDVFVYINNKQVIDLGGIHGAQSKSVSVDSLNLTLDRNYKFDLFFCERHTSQSNLKIQTSIQLYCEFVDRCGVCEGDGQSCPCACDDGNECTTDTCDAISGECVYSRPKECGTSGSKAGWANTANIVGIVVGGTAFVGIATLGGKKAYDKYSDKKGAAAPATTDTGLFYKWALRSKGPQAPSSV